MFHRLALGVCLLGVCTLSTGCGKSGPEFAPVEGTVLVKGKPHRGLVVRFLPDSEKGNNLSAIATGTTDEQGKYKLQYNDKGKEGPGAPVGWHRVLIEDASRGPTPQGQTPPPPLVSLTYSSPSTTPLRQEVKSGAQTIDLEVK